MNSVLQADFFQSKLLVSIIGKKVLTLRSKQVRIANGSTSSKWPLIKLGGIYSYSCIFGIGDGWYSPEIGWGDKTLLTPLCEVSTDIPNPTWKCGVEGLCKWMSSRFSSKAGEVMASVLGQSPIEAWGLLSSSDISPFFISPSLFGWLLSGRNNFSRTSVRCCHTGAELRSKDPGASIFFSFRHNLASCSFFFSNTISASIRQPPDSEKQLSKPHIWL